MGAKCLSGCPVPRRFRLNGLALSPARKGVSGCLASYQEAGEACGLSLVRAKPQEVFPPEDAPYAAWFLEPRDGE